MTEPVVTPLVRAEARRRGVPLANLRGTGAGGRVSLADVRAAAPAALPGAALGSGSRGGPRSSTVEVASRFGNGRVTIDPYGRNPLLEDLRQTSPTGFAAAAREGLPPTLFESGDLPPFTASGVDPVLLLRLPYWLRHEAASAVSAGAVLAMLEETATDPDGHLYDTNHPGLVEYANRIYSWAVGPAPSYVTD